jgi:hypothetical protein
MNEYYKKRYNLSNYFLNIDNDDYATYMYIILILILIILIIYTIHPILFIIINKRTNISIIIYIIFLIVLYIISYNLYISLKNISSNELILSYHNYYKLANIIFKENLNNPNLKSDFKNRIIKNIKIIENIYDNNKANIYFNTSTDILKYYTHINLSYDNTNENSNIENIYTQRLYIDLKNFKFLHINLESKFINNDTNNIDLMEISNDDKHWYVDLKIMEENYKDSNEKKLLLKYINNKYYTNFNNLYIPSIFTSKFNKKLDNIINNLKNNIYNFIYISIFFLFISLQNLLIQYNFYMVHIYLAIIISLFIFMYYYTNT